MEQQKITSSGPLLDADGNLTQVGWATQPLLDCNLENTRSHLPFWQPMRLKQWDYYGITTPTHFFSFTVSDVGYIGSIFAYVVDFEGKKMQEATLTVPLAKGVSLPRNSTAGVSKFSNDQVKLHFEVHGQKRHLSACWQNFNGTDLKAEVDFLVAPEHDSMTIVIPIKGKRFYYNRKINCMPASGIVEYAGQTYSIEPKTCLGNLDWGRGVWEYNSFWVWASASGFLPGGHTVGLNMGFGFGDTSKATENAVIIDGRLHKFGQVDFAYTSGDFMKPWRMTSPDGRVNLTFTPFLERVAKTDLKVLGSEVHQMFGRYNGCVVTDAGEEVQIVDLIGFAEEHHAKW